MAAPAARKLLPPRLRESLRAWQRDRALRRGLDAGDWQRLVDAWGNPGYSALPGYLAEVAARARLASNILECGSGLSTLVLANVAAEAGAQVWTLENHGGWFEKVTEELRRLRLNANVSHTPLRSYGDFDWYDVDAESLPQFDLVVCDGPAGSTRGGRYGLLPVMSRNLKADATILLDDADRAGEQDVLARWRPDVKSIELVETSRDPYAIVALGTPGAT